MTSPLREKGHASAPAPLGAFEVEVQFFPAEPSDAMYTRFWERLFSQRDAALLLEDLEAFFGDGQRECWALRCFADGHIEGFERGDGKRFTMTEWRRARDVEWPSPLDTERMRLQHALNEARREVSELEEQLASVAERYIDWGAQ